MRNSVLQSRLSPSFIEVESFAEGFGSALSLWFDQANELSQLESCFVAPNTATLVEVKRKLLAEGQNLLGVSFYTPATLRAFLLNKLGMLAPLRHEDLCVLMRSCADTVYADTASPEARSLSLEPELGVEACRLLIASGWGMDMLGSEGTRKVLEMYLSEIKHLGALAPGSEDWRIREKIVSLPGNVFNKTLVYGFSSSHWEDYNLLFSLSKSSRVFQACFITYNSDFYCDQVWKGAWESFCEEGNSKEIFEQKELESPFSDLSANFITPALLPSHSVSSQNPIFALSQNISEEADLIVSHIASYLKEDTASKIGVVFPSQSSPLAAEIAQRLDRKNVFYCDHIGRKATPTEEVNIFLRWIDFQKSLTLDSFLSFQHDLLLSKRVSANDYQALKQFCDKAFQLLMVVDLKIISAATQESDIQAKEAFEKWSVLPDSALFSDFLASTEKVLIHMGWDVGPKQLMEKGALLSKGYTAPITKESFLDWLKQSFQSGERKKSAFGAESFAAIHLLTSEEAVTQEWTHLILASLNQEDWDLKKTQRTLLPDEEVRKLNQKASVMGEQGEGHYVLRPNHILLPDEVFKQNIFTLLFGKLLALPSKGLFLSAHVQSPGAASTEVHEFYSRLFALVYKRPYDEAIRNELQRHTSLEWDLLKNDRLSKKTSIQQTLNAFERRRALQQVFDEYSYCFSSSPVGGLALSCKEWEGLLSSPEHTWFQSVLKCKKETCFLNRDVRSLVVGTWVHDWLSWEGVNFRKKPSLNEWIDNIERKASAIFLAARNVFVAAGKNLPEWWMACWYKAKSICFKLAKKVSENQQIESIVSEYKVALPEQVRICSDSVITIKGRIDLLAKFSGRTWVLDFKTGVKKPLSLKGLEQGDGLQLALYMHGLRALGHDDLYASIVTPSGALDLQIAYRDLEQLSSLWEGISKIYKTGKVGAKSVIRDKYSFTGDFPLATLQVDKAILNNKWQLTHPELSHNN